MVYVLIAENKSENIELGNKLVIKTYATEQEGINRHEKMSLEEKGKNKSINTNYQND